MTEILVGALGGFVAWLLGEVVALFMKRRRLMSYLEVCLCNYFDNAREGQRWLKRVETDTLRVGQVVTGAPLYSRDELEDLASVREESLELLKRVELVKLTKCHRVLWELEALMEGFSSALRGYQANGHPLDEDDVRQMRARANRIHASIDQLPQRLASLSDLPDDYPGRVGPDQLVPPGRRATKAEADVREEPAAPQTAVAPIDIAQKLASFRDEWAPKIIGQVNNHHFKLVKLQGEFVWHAHADTDEAFLVVDGEMTIHFRDRDTTLRAGEMLIVPRGTEHNTSAQAPCSVMLVERANTVNTGDVASEKTAPANVWI